MSNSEILREFLLETHENLSLLDADLLRLEQFPTEKDTLAQVFRTFHSVKGTAGFMGFEKLQRIAHSAENLLSRLRAGELRFNATIATSLLHVVDAIREIMSRIEATSTEGDGDYSELTGELERLRAATQEELDAAAQRPPAPANIVAPPAPVLPPPPAPVVVAPAPAAPVHLPSPAPPAARSPLPAVTAEFSPFDTVRTFAVHPEITVESSPPSPESTAVSTGTSSDSAVLDALDVRSASSILEAVVRVDVTLLDKLMTLVGELVLARNQLLRHSDAYEDGGLHAAVQKLNRLTSELQSDVMKTRMQPIGSLLNKFPRVVRDMAIACHKKVRLEMEGLETELDRTLIEAIRDPLTHMVRNAIDHGLETPQQRLARGKPEEGKLRLVAYHEGGKVIVEVTDDGAGIDAQRVRDKAQALALAPPEALARMTRQELLRFLFLPGFSTAQQVTQYSGRGVGLDVVRTNVEKIGGKIDLESTLGAGTTIRLQVPLTLAIVPALVVDCGGDRYAIPQASLLELVRVPAEQKQRVERVQGAPVYRLRGGLLPLVYLAEQLQVESTVADDEDVSIVVLQVGSQTFGLVVDHIRDTEEIVVKPLQKQLKAISLYAGATIMGDGRVALVLDVLGLAQRGGALSGAKSRASASQDLVATEASVEADPVLLFEVRGVGQMALPLSLVARIETIPREQIELLGGQPVVQYRGGILRLLDVSQSLATLRRTNTATASDRLRTRATTHDRSDDTRAELPVVVCHVGDNTVGLAVDRVLDIVREPVVTTADAAQGTGDAVAIVDRRVTEFLDVAALARAAYPESVPGHH